MNWKRGIPLCSGDASFDKTEGKSTAMKIDGHIHLSAQSQYADSTEFIRDLNAAGMDGAAILSPSPLSFASVSPEERMDRALNMCAGQKNLFPFYWINPLEEGALQQVDLAVKRGFAGFKMICSNYYPGCRESMDVLEKIASHNKPVLFHSGILWDGMNSANYNRPGNFEALLDIPKLRFCLAHISWPWYDECIAVYGKFNNAYSKRPDLSCEMFIDVTPGTPRVYREEVFRHLLCSDYELRYNLIFGTDGNTNRYNVNWCQEWQERDNALYEKFIPEDVEDFKEHIYGKNFLRFIGLSDETPTKKIPLVGE